MSFYGKAFEMRYQEYEKMAEEGQIWSANGEKCMFMSKMTTSRLQARDDTESGERGGMRLRIVATYNSWWQLAG